MHGHVSDEAPSAFATFGRRRMVPRVCVADSKAHIRRFFKDAFEDLGFIASECDLGASAELDVNGALPDLVALGLSAGGVIASQILETLSAHQYKGKVLIFGQAASPMVTAIVGLGKELGLAMLPLLPTPFSDRDLRARVGALIPDDAPPDPPVHVGEALHAEWLELWYQPKYDARALSIAGAEALVRMRHPTWGIVPPACFIPEADDPHFGALCDFVLKQAARDWHYFFGEYGPVTLSVNLPLSYFRASGAIDELCRHLPAHPAFDSLIVEIESSELLRDLPLALQAAKALRFRNIAVAVDNLGANWPSLLPLHEFPFAEIKVDRAFVTGTADDRLKQSTCSRIIEFADANGARTVAQGIETRADFLTARALGFKQMQGFFFAKPTHRQKFARRALSRPLTLAE